MIASNYTSGFDMAVKQAQVSANNLRETVLAVDKVGQRLFPCQHKAQLSIGMDQIGQVTQEFVQHRLETTGVLNFCNWVECAPSSFMLCRNLIQHRHEPI